jgi:sarcosine oxidase subunit beta
MVTAKRTDVLVIGGGIAGLATAWMLAREGVAVTLVERGGLAGMASGANAGSLHAQIPHAEFRELGEGWARTYAQTIPLLLRSIALWQELEGELGADLEVSVAGGLLVADDPAQLAAIARKAAIERAAGLAVELLDAAEMRSLAPYLSERIVGGLLCPSEGKASPLAAGAALARAARASGVTILTGTPLLGLQRDGAGFEAQTPSGRIAAPRVVNAAGAEAAGIAAMLGLRFDVQGVPIQVNVTEAVAPLVPHLVYYAGGKLTLKQTRRGAFLIGGGWPARIDAQGRPQVDPASLAGNMATAAAVVPQLGAARLLRTWPAIVNGTADWRPILGEVPGTPGFFMLVYPWMGFTGGPIAARLVADQVLGRRPETGLGGHLLAA